jgi:clathrin heavy chain
LVERLSKELWADVLKPENTFRAQVIEQVISAALPESKNVDEVSVTVSAFLKAGLQLELISLLEKIVLHNSEFGGYKQLQSLLIITAVKSDQTRVMDYLNRLDNYEPADMATECLDYNLNEEALFIYRKFNLHSEAIDVLLNRIGDVGRAAEFADKVQNNEVWSRLGNAYLAKFQVNEAIECFMKSKDSSQYFQIINLAENEGKYEVLIKFLLMARELIKDSNIDNSLSFAYAKLSKNTDLETFINGANSVDAQRVGDRCFEEKLYEAAKILYISIKNNAKIASCLVRLKQFQAAIDSA